MGLQPIQPVADHAGGAGKVLRLPDKADGAATQPANGGLGIVAAQAGMNNTATAVQSQVDALLMSFGQELGNDQFLRMVIALLILNALLTQGQEEAGSRAQALSGLTGGSDAFGQHTQVAMFSSTSIIQIQQQSTLIYTGQAVQGASSAAFDGSQGQPTRLDVQA